MTIATPSDRAELLAKLRDAVKLRNEAHAAHSGTSETLYSRTKEVGTILIEARKDKSGGTPF